MKKGVSRAAYALHRGCSPTTVLRRIKDGTLTGAIIKGSDPIRINPDKADVLWANDTRAGESMPPALREARRRKLLAQLRVEADRVAELRAASVPVDELAPAIHDATLLLAARLFTLAHACRGAAGLTPQAASALVQGEVHTLLIALGDEAEAIVEEVAADEDAEDFGALPTAVVAEKLVAYQAERLELVRAVKRGRMVSMEKALREDDFRVSTTRQRLLGMHSKMAAQLSLVKTEDEAERVVARELRDIVTELACQWCPRADIVAIQPKPSRRTR